MSMAGRMVRYSRRRAGLTQRQLAAKAGIPQETIARIEAGRSDPRVMTLDRLLEACEMGLEVMPRLGIGVDRTHIVELIALPMEERLRQGIESDRNVIEFGRKLRRVAE
jgi:transcriptional regulator with XRE-family HTH domain